VRDQVRQKFLEGLAAWSTSGFSALGMVDAIADPSYPGDVSFVSLDNHQGKEALIWLMR